MPYIKLTGHYSEQTPGGVYIGHINMTVRLGNGVTVELPLPFVPLGSHLGVAPVVEPGEAGSVRLDFTRWTPVSYGDVTARFPFNFDRQDMAVKVTRAFDNDPATNWNDDQGQIMTWLRTWGASHSLSFA
ncbi:hypothetical protein ACFQ05_04425 [Amycolatopsis umgeniensis]|uniref:Uncharacterized protein n=1 Tax=Amycolatopsis umgeniensis TaxID=336628 RepID=A0A841B1N1_9PSEU|nr:hypothetical protein [Amycolatopsis umgeniensis]MBB5852512.1 hypothetical protein [Amycolatopsis umgeniensis]